MSGHKFKIIFLIDSVYPYYTGGRETWLYNVCNRLCANYEITIIAEKKFRGSERFGCFESIDSRIRILSVNNLRNISFLCPFIRSYFRWINQEFSARMMKRKLKKVLDSIGDNAAYVITMDTIFTAKAGRWAKKHYDGVKFIVSVRCPHAELAGTCYPMLKGYLLKSEKKNLEKTDDIWANGWDTQDMLKKKGFDSVVIKNGVDFARAQMAETDVFNDLPLKGDYNIITIGTLLDIKGYPELIQAISIVHKKYKLKANLVALGKGNPKRYIQMAEELNIGEYINFVGERRQTIECAKKCDLAACLSGGSGLSMACLESMASKTPVIAWDTPVYRQLITHKISGYLVREKDVDALAEGIVWMLSHKEKSKDMGNQAYNTAKEYDWDNIVKSIIARIGHDELHD